MHLWRWLAALLFCLALFLASNLIWSERGYLALREMQQHSRSLEEKLSALEEENRKLSREIRTLKDDREHLEKIIKTETHWLREDEVLYLFPTKP
jgi:cell division protein FtsB